MKSEHFLLQLCDEIYRAEQMAELERKNEFFGEHPPTELLIIKKEKVCVEIRKESVSHHKPHIHITHSDKIDVSICLNTFSILAGQIDSKTQKQLLKILKPKQRELKEIWNELNEKDNSIEASKLIQNLNF